MADRYTGGQLYQFQGIQLAVDGLKPEVGHEALWGVRNRVSGEILLARPLLSEREADQIFWNLQ